MLGAAVSRLAMYLTLPASPFCGRDDSSIAPNWRTEENQQIICRGDTKKTATRPQESFDSGSVVLLPRAS